MGIFDGIMDIVSKAAPIVGSIFGGPSGGAVGSLIGSITGKDVLGAGLSLYGGYQAREGQQESNALNYQMFKETQDFNSAQAANQMAFQRESQDKQMAFQSASLADQYRFMDTWNRENMAFAQRNSDTAYQRAVRDMQAAGLNPMLAYSQGGSSTPSYSGGTPSVASGSSASGAAASVSAPHLQSPKLAALNTALTVARAAADIDNTKADTNVKNAQAGNVEQQTRVSKETADTINYKLRHILPEEQTQAVTRSIIMGYEEATSRFFYNERYRQEAFRKIVEGDIARAGLTEAHRKAVEYELPGLYNQMKIDESGYGQNVRPYLPDAQRVTSAIGSLSGAASGVGLRLPRRYSRETSGWSDKATGEWQSYERGSH